MTAPDNFVSYVRDAHARIYDAGSEVDPISLAYVIDSVPRLLDRLERAERLIVGPVQNYLESMREDRDVDRLALATHAWFVALDDETKAYARDEMHAASEDAECGCPRESMTCPICTNPDRFDAWCDDCRTDAVAEADR